MELTDGQRMIKYGFIKPGNQKKYIYDDVKKFWVPKNPEKGYEEADADQEIYEQATVMPAFDGPRSNYVPSGFPDTVKKYRLLYKSQSTSMEETYYWILDHLRVDMGFPHAVKIMDVFSASEQSAFWGQSWARMGIQQDRVTQFMATIGKMVKDLFQLVRELRILDERLEVYDKAPDSKSADVTLKGYYIDLVEGGAKNPSSVYGVAQTVGFTILPDLFFNTHIYDIDSIESVIESMNWNIQVKNVLRRKLYSFLVWKDKTEIELRNRYRFTLRYLRQHWGVIKMYMTWVKPYLKNIKRMRMRDEHIQDADIVTAFETSITEVETLLHKPPTKDGIYPCILLSMRYMTQAEMSYHQEGYQHKGPIHFGQVEWNIRAYGWTDKDIENYKKYKDDEDMDLIKLIDESVAAAMDALGEELQKYLSMADEQMAAHGIQHLDNIGKSDKKSKAAAKAVGSALDPFISIFRGFGEIFTSFGGGASFGKGKKKKEPTQDEKDAIAKDVLMNMYLTYKNYKKAHEMLSW